MARPKKKSLSYFPLDVDVFEDEKLFDVQNDYGPLGEVIYLRLLCLVYKHGYYFDFGTMDKLAGLVIRSIGNRWTRSKQVVSEVISLLAKNNLFSAELMRSGILTSRSIQQRYQKALERNQPEITEYCLIEKNDDKALVSVPEKLVSATKTQVSATKTQVSATKTQPKKRKEKKSKINNIYNGDKSPSEDNAASQETSSKAFRPPTVEEVKAYCSERNNGIDAEQFVDFYASKGWFIGKNKMKDWKAAVRTWERSRKESGQVQRYTQRTSENPNVDSSWIHSTKL